ncbi:MAG: cyclic nucleotide-binding domain-containing protein [Acidobacteriia bacterium]|nr:cyclic nucleotide-binding domain-containing protein [Terriglobia bacterium]
MTLESLVSRHGFTQGLTDEQVARVAALATEVQFAEDALILEEGQLSEYLYLLLSGSVAVELRTSQFTVCVQALGASQAFGWSALLDHQDTFFQVRARESVHALRLQGRELKQLCRSDGQLGTELLLRTLRLVAGRVKATEERFAEMCGVRLQAAAD